MSMNFSCSLMLLIASWSAIVQNNSLSVEASTLLRGRTDDNSITDTASAVTGDASDRKLTRAIDTIFNSLLEPSKRIVNGQNAPEGRFPWFVRVLGPKDENGGMVACGGSLIAPDMALFAAHCGSAAQAIIGPYNLDDVQGGYRNVILTVPHPNYPSGDLLVNFDISIAFFDRPSTDKKPIKLNFDDSLPSTSGEPLTMLGFGSVIGGKETFTPDGPNQQARILQVAPTEYVSFDDCAVAVDPESGNGYGVSPTDTIVQPHWFCTLLNDPITTSTCYGDSGGPIIQEGATFETDLLMAVISGASGYCGNPYLPLQNQRVSYHKDWIIQTGCQYSVDPPAEWNCDQGGFAPETTPVPEVSPPTETPAPSASATSPPVPSPTQGPSRRPTAESTRQPTPPPTNQRTSSPQSPPTIAPSREDANGILPPSLDIVPTVPTPLPTVKPSLAPDSNLVGDDDDDGDGNGNGNGGDDDDDDNGNGGDPVYVCPVCSEGYNISRPNSTVLVPILGEFLCSDLVAAAQAGEFSEGQCGIIQIVSLPCLCEPAGAGSDGDEGGDDDESDGGGEGGDDGDSEGGSDNTGPTSPPFSLTDPQSPDCLNRDDNENALVPITISIQFDDSPEDIGWYIADEAYRCFRVGVPAMAYNKNLTSVEEVVYVIGGLRYMFVIEDSKGDGLCCGRVVGNSNGGTATSQVSRPGSYTVMSGDIMLASGGGDFGVQEMNNFTAPER